MVKSIFGNCFAKPAAIAASLTAWDAVTSPAIALADKTIKIGFLAGDDDEDFDGAMVFKHYVESRTNGRIEVEIYDGAQFCADVEQCLESVNSGTLEVTMSTIGGFGNIFPEAQVLDVPYMFRDDRVAECVFDGPFVTELRDAVLEATGGTRLMTISNTGGWRNFATTGHQIKSSSDVESLEIRTISAEIQEEMVRLLGGIPKPIEWPEVYAALADGTVVGTKNGITDIINMNLQDHLNFITLDGHAYMASLWWINQGFWDGLDKPDKRIVYDGFQHLKTVTRAYPMRRQIEAYEEFRKAGGTIYVPSPEEKAAFRKAVSPVREWFTDQHGTEWMSKLQGAIGECEETIDAELQ